MLQYIVLLGAAVNLAGCSAYIRDTLSGKTKPNRVSFLLWSLILFIGTAAEFSDGVRWAAVPVFMSGFCPFMVLAASFVNKNAYWKLQSFDYICGFLSLLAVVLWRFTHQPSVAIVFAIAGDLLAALPVLKKSWTDPETESRIAFVCGAFAAATSFFAIQEWKFTEYAFPAYIVAIDLTIFFVIYLRSSKKALS
jgi:hypothetical protein